jgi:hypothetical protein
MSPGGTVLYAGARCEKIFSGEGMRAVVTALLAGAVFASPAAAQDKKLTTYWMSAATGEGGLSAVGIAGMDLGALVGSAMMGGSGGASERSLTLQLSSPLAASGTPEAAHEIPAGMKMGPSLPLRGPKREPAPARNGNPADPSDGDVEKPEGKITIYWGCGEKVRSGQPRVFDMATMDQAAFAKAFAGRSARQQPPSPATGKTYAVWPNAESATPVPHQASLQGAHRVAGNFTPEIRFTVGPAHDFMAPVKLTKQGGVEEAIALTWEAIPTAIGQFASAFAADDDGGMVLWSSSNVQEPGWGLHDYLPSANVDKWVKEGVLLPPRTTSCTIPAGIFAQAGGAMVRFTAYGRGLNLVWPEQPKEPQWSVKLRLKSTAMLPLDDGGDVEESPDDVRVDSTGAEDTATEGPTHGYGGNPVEAIGNIMDAGSKLRGMFGR